MGTALITGIRGFTGRYLAAELRQAGHSVVGLAHSGTATEDGIYVADLLNRESLRLAVRQIQPDHVIHLAAISFVAHGDAEAIYRTNVVGTRNLLEALSACATPPSSVLLASSANVYGNSEVDAIDESVPPQPSSDYGVSKLAMEQMARLWFDRLPITIVRPFNYTGVGQSEKFLPAKIAAHFRRGERNIELGNLDVWRDFSDVRTVVNVYRRLIEAAPAGEVFNVCSGCVYSVRDILNILQEIANYSIGVKVNTALVRANELKRLRGSNGKLKRAIGDIENIPLRQTLEWMYKGSTTSV